LRRVIYITPTLEEGEGAEISYAVKVSSELWAHAAGGSLTDEEIRELREKYKDSRRPD